MDICWSQNGKGICILEVIDQTILSMELLLVFNIMLQINGFYTYSEYKVIQYLSRIQV